MYRIILTTIAIAFSLMAGNILATESKDIMSYEEHKKNLLEQDFKYEGTRTKVYGDTIVRKFEIYCTKWCVGVNDDGSPDSTKKCRWISKDNRLFADSAIHKPGNYTLFEQVFDADGNIIYEIFFENFYSIERYESRRLVASEFWCDTIQLANNPYCLSFINGSQESLKLDSLGKFLIRQTRFVWDKKGRLKQRIIWDMGNPYGLNGTYEFIYKSPCDTIRVVPEDRVWGWDGAIEGRYDGSFGKIPEMGDPEYENFAAAPYSFRQSEELLERQKKRCADYKKSLKKK